jgi:hypothetical protein
VHFLADDQPRCMRAIIVGGKKRNCIVSCQKGNRRGLRVTKVARMNNINTCGLLKEKFHNSTNPRHLVA